MNKKKAAETLKGMTVSVDMSELVSSDYGDARFFAVLTGELNDDCTLLAEVNRVNYGGWQSMNTAPKGKNILLALKSGPPVVGFFNKGTGEWQASRFSSVELNPVFWMPIRELQLYGEG